MSNDPLLRGARGERHLLLGNEAIVRGALEAGVHMVSCYPGTPSSEVADTFLRLGGEGRYRLEYSINEKVAMEVAAGGALGGAMSLVAMKHVGLNVAADPLFTSVYIGLPGGLVVLTADDPGCHSSQNEQDNRHYARFASLPCFEPVSAQEAKEMTREAFRLARELQQPVMLRTTTRVSHMRGPVDFDDLPAPQPKVEFKRDPGRFVPVPAVALRRHAALDANMEKARQIAEGSRFNVEREPSGGQTRLGVIASGVARNYLADALASGGWEDRVRVLELGMTWPLPNDLIGAFLQKCDRVLVLEEGAELLEQNVRALAQLRGLNVRIEGKDETLSGRGEYSTTLVLRRLAAWLDCPCPAKSARPVETDLPGRPPNLCPGCSHRAVYYAVRQVFGDDAVYSSDIGCYTLGLLPPLRTADFLVCMGSSVSAGSGFARASGKPVVGFIGDSTFFHSGMTGLANAVFNHHDLLLVILDNGTTAMTGHQPNPTVGYDIRRQETYKLDLEALCRAVGVNDVKTVDPYDLEALEAALRDSLARDEVSVIIARRPCALLEKGKKTPYSVDADKCRGCGMCLKLGCPAIERDGKKARINPALCVGCDLCARMCKFSAIGGSVCR